MGNKQENNNENLGKFNMQISLNRFNFFPGETIKGSIELSPKDEYLNDFTILKDIKLYYALLHKECWKSNIAISKDKTKEINSININDDSEINNYKTDMITSKKEVYNINNEKNQKNNIVINFQIKIPLDTKHVSNLFVLIKSQIYMVIQEFI